MPAPGHAPPRAGPAAPDSVLPDRRSLALGVVVAVSATGLALAGHVVAGGAPPTATSLGALTLTAIVACVLLGGAQWRLPSLLGALVGMQVIFHLAFGGAAGAAPPAQHPSGGHGHHGHSPAAHDVMAGSGFGWQMLTGHVVAVLLTALLIRRGEQGCRFAATVLARPFQVSHVLRSPGVSSRPALLVAGETGPASMLSRLVLCAAPRRGPPAPLVT